MNNYNYKLYDNIISATYVNIYNSIIEKGENGVFSVGKDVIFSNPAKKNDYAYLVFEKVGYMVASNFERKVAVPMNFLKYLYQRYIKKNSLIRRKKRTEHSNIDVETLSRFEIDAFEVNENIFEDIWNAYYKENK